MTSNKPKKKNSGPRGPNPNMARHRPYNNLAHGMGGVNQSEVARRLGVTQQRVDQIEREALLKLRLGLGIVQRVRVSPKGAKGAPKYRIVNEPTAEGREYAEAFAELMNARSKTPLDNYYHEH